MKKLILFLIILFLPSILAGLVLYRYYPSDSKNLIEILKVKIVKQYPPLEMYIQIERPPIKKPISIENSPKRVTLPNVPIFLNSDIYEAVCGEIPRINLSQTFSGCAYCPKYLAKVTNDNNFRYFSSVRGSFLRKGEEEAVIFMKGCGRSDDNGSVLIVRKGFGGWRREQLFQNILFDSPPLEFKDEDGFFIFVGKRTKSTQVDVHSELISVRINKNGMSEKILFSSVLDTGERCTEMLQISFENPLKKNSKQFDSQIEILSCKKGFLSGSYILHFNLNENDFKPNFETSKLMTRIEKYGELK
ncbi:hypothetical protein [Fluviispira multicolorata]|uniref:Uncharacterized protein n=1 Tax=Fluviispira multicolorata TaxID=2654512 RepID=A0A833N4N6_9BACT|nr:hypothetical protein [Fluviispira multicolorata]KAB8032211.1 hypothetical protein GCL57_06070 [Fluviispira multicolorata]